jgi:hypothetical protein
VASIKDMMAGLRTIRANYAQASATVDANWRLSDAAKDIEKRAHREAERAAVVDTARAIFGEAGAFWTERDALRAKLRDARDRADTMDPARLSNAYRRVPGIVTGAQDVRELETWYRDRADSYERRALQDTGAEVIERRFSGSPETGGLLAALKRDRAEAMATPEVRDIENRIALLEQDAYNAHGELSKHLREVGEGGPWSDGGRILQNVVVDMRFDDVTRPDAKATYTVEKWVGAGVYQPIKEL